ncbi:hypothetical protein GGS24DRAFT_502664 [Hypoxylon argillaceum]|nr:hypothetical protein GGS24DRAFT_502664 [Hypoxylon argillaceum]
MAPFNKRPNGSQRPHQYGPAKTRPTSPWSLGDIAFLKAASGFTQTERIELLDTNRVHSSATCHPVIILDRSDDSEYYIVTTVSAYSSSEADNYLPPWKQAAHRRKDINSFRAFEGSATPNNGHQHLRLADNKRWPKVETSWVYIQRPYLVPVSTLIHYNKCQCRLRMDPESLQDLLGHMKAKSWAFRKLETEIRNTREVGYPPRKNSEQIWGQDNKEQVSQAINHIFKLTNLTNRNHPMSPGKVTRDPTKMASWRTGLSDSTAVAAKATSSIKKVIGRPQGQFQSWNHGNRYAGLT